MNTSGFRLFPLFATLGLIAEACAAGTSYPPPFDDAVNSVFGPRYYSPSPFHTGIDYLASSGTSIPSAAASSIARIDKDNNPCGVRLYLTTVDHIVLGYCHLFTNSKKTVLSSGDFTFLERYKFDPIPIQGLRKRSIPNVCNVIISNTAGVALTPGTCFKAGRSVAYGSKTYPAANKVSSRQAIAPVGDSGSAASRPHLHLNYGYGKDNPLLVTDHPEGSFCARLADAGVSSSACDAVTTTPSIDKTILTSRKYFDIRVDATNRLDLDDISFTFSTSPAQAYSLRYGGTAATDPFVNDSTKIKDFIDVNCSKTPDPGKVLICPLDWRGQPQPSSRLETVFRLGIDPNTFLPGSYQLGVTLVSVTGKTTNLTLPFNVGGLPTATLTVPDLQTGWSGLPAVISLTDLVVTPRTTFQINGNSSTCGGGERGSPLYSNTVPAAATFYAARTVTGVPSQTNGPGVNRRNCSSFVAVQLVPNPLDANQLKQRVWVNATGRGQQFTGSITFDWESQIRFDSGDPWNGNGKSCVGGTVANAGFFGAAWSSANCAVSLNF